MKKWGLFTGLVLAVLTAAISCNKEKNTNPGNNSGLDRKPMLENYTNNYIIPAYDDLVIKLQALQSNAESFTANPNGSTHNDLFLSWFIAYATWQKIDMLEFGPAERVGLRVYMNIYPVTVSKLNNNIASGTYNLEEFGNRDVQGFPALDYLINGSTVQSYITGPDATNKKNYLKAVIAKMLEKTTAVKNEWGSYKSTFVSATGTDVNSSLSQMVNAYVLYYERYLRSGKIGLPAGVMTGIPKPEIIESFYYQTGSKDLAKAALTAVMDFYSGKSYDGKSSGESMKSYMTALGTKDDAGKLMADVITHEMQEASAAFISSGTLYNNIQNDRPQILTFYEELQDVVPLLKVDMVSAFSISITYTDNDGD